MLYAQFADVRSTDLLPFGFTLIFIGAMVFSVLPNSLHQQPPANYSQTSPNFNLSDNSGDSIYPALAASGNNVYVAWQDDNFGKAVSYDKKDYDILFTRSVNGGKSFENTTNLSDTISLSERPVISASGNNVYIVWTEDTLKEKRILFRKSTDGGNTFEQTIHLGSSNYVKDYILPKEIASFGDNVYVVWRHLTEDGQTSSILLRSSKDSGNTFGEAIEISGNAAYTSSPKVATFNNNVYVVWDATFKKQEKTGKSEGMFLVKSSDGGLTFENETRINNTKEIGEAQVAAYLNEVYIAWAGSVYSIREIDNVYLTYSLNGGDTFVDTTLINKGFVDIENVDIDKTEGKMDVLWQDRVTANGEIFHMSLNTKPTLFDPPTNLSNNPGLSECPSLALSGNATYIIWEDNTYGNHEILFKRVVSI
jgi:hypothetical protein